MKLPTIAGLFAIGGLTMASSPHVPITDGPLRALSPERVEALRLGRGAGYALAAELNGYPGPRHVLDLAAGLDLSAAQKAAAQRLFDAMKAEAVEHGGTLLAREQAIEDVFRSGSVSEDALFEATAGAAAAEARLRATHLKYHVRMAELMTAHQRRLYEKLRGYAAGSHVHGGSGRRPH